LYYAALPAKYDVLEHVLSYYLRRHTR
jgi:hypothetical protein